MEELRRLAIEYYKNTISLKLFGIKGGAYILVSVPFLALTLYLHFTIRLNFLTVLSMFAGGLLWREAQKEYRKKLLQHLQFYTHSNNDNIREQKAIYLQSITSHVASSVFETMKIFREIIEIDNHNKSFVLNNGWHHFFNFIYNSESKNRILSLLIYLISLIAILTVVKPELNYDIYELISQFSFELVKEYFLIVTFAILMGYAIIVIPIMFFVTYVFVPLMLQVSSHSFLIRFFISELNQHSFLECK